MISLKFAIGNQTLAEVWSFEDNKRYDQITNEVGYDYVLLQTRFIASYGAENQLEVAPLFLPLPL